MNWTILLSLVSCTLASQQCGFNPNQWQVCCSIQPASAKCNSGSFNPPVQPGVFDFHERVVVPKAVQPTRAPRPNKPIVIDKPTTPEPVKPTNEGAVGNCPGCKTVDEENTPNVPSTEAPAVDTDSEDIDGQPANCEMTEYQILDEEASVSLENRSKVTASPQVAPESSFESDGRMTNCSRTVERQVNRTVGQPDVETVFTTICCEYFNHQGDRLESNCTTSFAQNTGSFPEAATFPETDATPKKSGINLVVSNDDDNDYNNDEVVSEPQHPSQSGNYKQTEMQRSFQCPSDWEFFDKTLACYKVISETQNFVNAEIACTKLKSHLVSIHTEEENDFVNGVIEIAAQKEKASTITYIGAKTMNGKYQFMDGSKYEWTNWSKKTPAHLYKGKDCTYLNPEPMADDKDRHTWKPIECSKKERFVCKQMAEEVYNMV